MYLIEPFRSTETLIDDYIMSLKTSAVNARVSWISEHQNETNPELLTAMHGILYIPTDPRKVGQVTKNTVEGMTEGEAFESRYKDKSTRSTDMIAEDIYVFDKIHGPNYAYDDGLRRLVHKLYEADKIPFDALTPEYQLPNENSEALIGYSPRNHRRIMDKVMRQYFGKQKYWDARRGVKWRWGQADEVNEIVNKLLLFSLCLYAAYTGRGKTTISVGVVTKLLPKGGLVLVTTPIKDTRDGFEDKIEGWHFGGDRNRKITFIDNDGFAKTTAKELRERADNGELIFVVLTVQDVRYQDQNTEFNKLRGKYNALAGLLDVWIRDEKHLQYQAELTAARLGNLSAKYELDLTATPYNVMDNYETHQIVARTLVWGLKNRKHTELPQIMVDAIQTPFSAVAPALASLYTTEEGFNPRKLWVRKNGNFVLQSEIVALDELFYRSKVSKNRNQLSIVNDTELSMVSKRCGMWVLPEGMDGDSATDYIPAAAKMLNANSNGETYYASSYHIEERAKATGLSIGSYVARMLAEHPRVVILTHRKFTTGTDIEALGHIVLFDNITTIAEFEQLMGRMARVHKGKDVVKLYGLMPGQALNVLIGRLKRESAALAGVQEVEMKECIPFTEYDTGKPRRVDFAETLEATQEYFRNRVKERLPSASLAKELSGMDLSVLKDIDLSKFKSTHFKSEITEKNGSKVAVRLNAKGKPQTKEERNQVAKLIALMQTIMQESQWIAYKDNCYDHNILLSDKILSTMFGSTVVDSVYQIIKSNPTVEKMVSDWLRNKQQAYSNLPLEDVIDEVFANSSHKQEQLNLVYTPFAVAQAAVDCTTIKPKTIGVMNALNGSMALAVAKKFPNTQITCIEESPIFVTHLSKRFRVIDFATAANEEFDLIVTNPPYNTRGKTKYYIKYFQFALDHAKQVACVMPHNPNTHEAAIVTHNNRVSKHKIFLSQDLTGLYPSIKYANIRCVVASRSQENQVSETKIESGLDKRPLLLPSRERLSAICGKEVLVKETEVESGFPIIWKVKADGLEYKKIATRVARKHIVQSKAKYLVIINRTPSRGKFSAAVVLNKNVVLNRWVFAFEAQGKSDAESLKEWLTSDKIKNEVRGMFESKMNFGMATTISKDMLNRLPSHRID